MLGSVVAVQRNSNVRDKMYCVARCRHTTDSNTTKHDDDDDDDDNNNNNNKAVHTDNLQQIGQI
jgi:hypothetical protein